MRIVLLHFRGQSPAGLVRTNRYTTFNRVPLPSTGTANRCTTLLLVGRSQLGGLFRGLQLRLQAAGLCLRRQTEVHV